MVENERSAESASASAAAMPHRKKASSRRKPGTRKRAQVRKRAVPQKRTRKANTWASLLEDFSRRAARTGTRIAAASEEGLSSARRTLARAGTASKKTMDRLAREWKHMDSKKRAQLVAALAAALAAASAPIVGRRLKKK